MTLTDALRQAAAAGLDRLDAQMLLLFSLGRDPNARAWLSAHDDQVLSADQERLFEQLCRRRAQGEPLPYLTGTKEFFGLPLKVDGRVLVPRPDTETLVLWAMDVVDAATERSSIPLRALDLGTGSGAIALALKSSRPHTHVWATDASPEALAVAQANAEALHLAVSFRLGHWLAAVPGERFDLILSNPPYIKTNDPHLAQLQHEPFSALVSGPDGLDDLRHLIAEAPSFLVPGGWLLLEHGHDQAGPVRDLLERAGFEVVTSRTDLAGIERCSGGQWPEQR
ncbi:peptide chain release factor N(5)-glutamine methyltransferase [Hydrogenophaga sp.]|uniref:peptide chain release factor N(5)-glutamine methyltransferase n=1 Tax=Hydrogenophaga sp. TaxID=1904254 RepID=UPI00271C0F74|nr:peptide chain release factor N(5)-glutamine methyltransferase [Hydrogenophaga sp.]MDO8903310.1 peptide chain release factor N(5)-glutamine methyltransferase [Hydrogenophaga sp.]